MDVPTALGASGDSRSCEAVVTVTLCRSCVVATVNFTTRWVLPISITSRDSSRSLSDAHDGPTLARSSLVAAGADTPVPVPDSPGERARDPGPRLGFASEVRKSGTGAPRAAGLLKRNRAPPPPPADRAEQAGSQRRATSAPQVGTRPYHGVVPRRAGVLSGALGEHHPTRNRD